MGNQQYSRRSFLAMGSAALVNLAIRPHRASSAAVPLAVGRVATPLIYVYEKPSFTSERASSYSRDTLINLLEEEISAEGPAYNPKWYRINGGYIHSGHVQKIEFRPPNPPLSSIPTEGMWGEVTQPFTRSFYRANGKSWSPLYRLYYESVHWIRGIHTGSDGTAWYRLFDPKNDSSYFVPAKDIRPISLEEYAPIRQDIAPDQKRVVVNIENQTLTAYEGDQKVLETLISSGIPDQGPVPEGEIPTESPKGSWRVSLKTPSRHMGDGRLTDQIDSYELPGVPWTMAFHKDGYALHGSYWHDNFGRRMSHGCINMRSTDALWLFRWSEPVFDTKDWYVKGTGTLIIII